MSKLTPPLPFWALPKRKDDVFWAGFPKFICHVINRHKTVQQTLKFTSFSTAIVHKRFLTLYVKEKPPVNNDMMDNLCCSMQQRLSSCQLPPVALQNIFLQINKSTKLPKLKAQPVFAVQRGGFDSCGLLLLLIY